MPRVNPCDNPADKVTQDMCAEGSQEFWAEYLPIIQDKQRLGMSLASGDTDVSDEERSIAKKADLLKGVLRKRADECDSGDQKACGFVAGADGVRGSLGSLGNITGQPQGPEAIKFKKLPSGTIVVSTGERGSTEMLIDTGCTISGFAPSFIRNYEKYFTRHGEIDNYDVSLFLTRGLRLMFGETKWFEPGSAIAAPVLDYLEGTTIGSRLVAIIGQDFLGSHPFEINYDAGVLTLDQDVRKRLAAGGWDAIPFSMTFKPGQWSTIDIYIDGKKLPMVFDTGGDKTEITPSCMAGLPGIRKESDSLQFGVNGNYGAGFSSPVDIRIGDTILEDRRISISSKDDPSTMALREAGTCGVIGLDVLTNFNIIYDPNTMSYYLQKRPDHVDRGKLSIGMSPKRDDDGKMSVSGIALGSPAEKAGLKVGDRIISVDGIPSERITIFHYKEMLSTEKRPFKFVILRDGKEMTVKVSPIEV